jgi:hypothetical protein
MFFVTKQANKAEDVVGRLISRQGKVGSGRIRQKYVQSPSIAAILTYLRVQADTHTRLGARHDGQ